MSDANNEERETTSTDDIRRVRQLLSERFGNDVRALGNHATEITEAAMERLGLRRDSNVKPTASTKSA